MFTKHVKYSISPSGRYMESFEEWYSCDINWRRFYSRFLWFAWLKCAVYTAWILTKQRINP